MTNLTDAQLRLIREAQLKDSHIINFYGIPEKTKTKLRDLGLFETVLNLSSNERDEMRAAIRQAWADLDAILDTEQEYLIKRTERSIATYLNRLFATKDVLTEKGLLVN